MPPRDRRGGLVGDLSAENRTSRFMRKTLKAPNSGSSRSSRAHRRDGGKRSLLTSHARLPSSSTKKSSSGTVKHHPRSSSGTLRRRSSSSSSSSAELRVLGEVGVGRRSRSDHALGDQLGVGAQRRQAQVAATLLRGALIAPPPQLEIRLSRLARSRRSNRRCGDARAHASARSWTAASTATWRSLRPTRPRSW